MSSINTTHLTERHVINRSHEYYNECDLLSFKAKNLYNSVIYFYRSIYFENENLYKQGKEQLKYPSWMEVNKKFVVDKIEAYYALPSKVSNAIVNQASTNWFSWLKAMVSFSKNPDKFAGKPKIPKYKDKETGRFIVPFNEQAISKKYLKNGLVTPSSTNWIISFINQSKAKDDKIKQVRIVPKNGYYNFEIIYEVELSKQVIPTEDGEVFFCGIDLGLNNLASCAITSGKGILIDGKALKHINQKYNKLIAEAKSKLPKGIHTSKHIENLWRRRDFKIKDFMHKSSTTLVNHLYDEHVVKVVVGKNDGWKSEANMGKRNNQNFVMVPHQTFINMLEYKCVLNGIELIQTEEAYTSKASCVDKDQLFKFNSKPKDHKFSGKRVHRGLYVSKEGIHINADMNGAVNILRKVTQIESDPQYLNWVRGCVVSPIKWRIEV